MYKRISTMLLTLFLCGQLCLSASAATPTTITPSGLLALSDGSLLVTDVHNKAIWQQTKDGFVRLAGSQGVNDAMGIPVGGYVDGKAENATFQMPWAATPYLKGWAISDTDNHVIRYLADGQVSTLAGSGKPGQSDGVGIKATFQRPTGLVTLDDGSILVSDTDNHVIRKIDTKGVVTTYAGSTEGCADGSLQSAKFREPTGLCYVNGVLYIADSGNNRICQLVQGQVSTLAGASDGTADFINGKAENARFSSPQGIAANGTSVFVADTVNSAIREICNGEVTTLVQLGQTDYSLYPVEPRALVLSDQTLFVGDVFASAVFSVALQTEASYVDVLSSDWFYDAVRQATQLGLMDGVGNGAFAPHETVTRAMSVTVLSRLEQIMHPNTVIGGDASFADVPADAYYAAPAAWAKAQGLATGDGENFMPNAPMTRADLATVLFRYAKQSALDADKRAELTGFADWDSIPDYAKEAFSWACAVGVIGGKDKNRLDPTGAITRAELSALLQRTLALA